MVPIVIVLDNKVQWWSNSEIVRDIVEVTLHKIMQTNITLHNSMKTNFVNAH